MLIKKYCLTTVNQEKQNYIKKKMHIFIKIYSTMETH